MPTATKQQNKHEVLHDEFQNEIIKIFKTFDIDLICDDTNSGPGKKCDLKSEKEKIIIELKTFQGGNELKIKEDEHLQNLNSRKIYTYWVEDVPTLLLGHLTSTKRKFKTEKYKDFKTILLIKNKLSFNQQEIYDLLAKNNIEISSSIGAIVQYYPESNHFTVIHNSFANEERKISNNFFEKFETEYSVYQCVYNRKEFIKM